MQHGEGIAREQAIFLETIEVLVFLFPVKAVVGRVGTHIGTVDHQGEANHNDFRNVIQSKVGGVALVSLCAQCFAIGAIQRGSVGLADA